MHGSELKRRNPRHIWDDIPITPDPAGLTARTALWIAEALKQEALQAGLAAQQAAAAPAAAPTAATSSARQTLQQGITSLIAALLPSKAEKADMHCVVEAVSNAINNGQQRGAWTVARAKSVGSFEKRTNLAGT
jgi:hypothetical protein